MMHNTNCQIRFKAIVLKSRLSDCSDAYLLVKGTVTITIVGAHVAARQANESDKEVILKNCLPFTNCITETNYTYLDNVKDINVVMPKHNLIEYKDSYSKTTGSLLQYYRDELYDTYDETKADSESFKFKAKVTRNTPHHGNTKGVEMTVTLKYLNNFWRTHNLTLT